MSDFPKIALFNPKDDKDLRKYYPELKRIEEFKSLKPKDLLFVWRASNPTSPIVIEFPEDSDFQKRLEKAYDAVYGKTENPDRRKKYIVGNVGPEIREAMIRMAAFKDDARYVSKMMIANIFKNLQMLSDADPKDFILTSIKDGEKIENIDWTGRKQYVDTCKSIMEMLPKTIQIMEEGFGVELDKENEGKRGIERFHEDKQN